MTPERLTALASCVDRFREAFSLVKAYPLAADMRDLYLIILEKRDALDKAKLDSQVSREAPEKQP